LLVKAIESLRQKTRFLSYPKLSLGALPFFGPLAAYRAVDPGCHIVPPSLLLKRVFDTDIEHCPNCGGSLKIIAAIEDPPVIVKILSHLGLPARAPAQRAAR